MILVEDALDKILALVPPVSSERVPLEHASGRYMTEVATARRDQPPFDASAMDGYALCGPVRPGDRFRVIGVAAAGHAFVGRVAQGQAVRIFTGAAVPDGANHVVIQEDVVLDGDVITLGPKLDVGSNIRATGQDFRVGDTLQPKRLGPNDLALLAAMNIPAVQASRRPTVAIIPTGDELVMPGEHPAPDQITASNMFALKAMAEAEGAHVRLLPIAKDTEAALTTVFSLAEGADLVLTIGGASVGDHDLVGRVAEQLGMERAFYRIAMRPGKPLMAGRLRGALMMGLPGNPVSAIVCGHLFLRPVLRAMQGMPAVINKSRAILKAPVGPNGPREHYMRARLFTGRGLPEIEAFDRQDSALLSVLNASDALLVRPIDGPALPAGTEVDYLAL